MTDSRDEKFTGDVSMIDNVSAEHQPVTIMDWSPEEEAKAKRKLDLVLLPLLFVGFLAYQLDKANIGNALTDTFMEDLNIDQNTVNNGNTLLFAAIVIFEVPFNLVMQKIGAPIWITFQIMSWGLVSTFQAFITNKASFYATRFLIGVFESAYSPGCMVLLAMFYKREELAMRTTALYVGNYFGSGIGSLLAAAILNMAGVNGLSGWQWLFLIEGAFTLFVGVLFVLFLPAFPLSTKGLLGPNWSDVFTDRDRHILHNRVILDDPYKKIKLGDLTLKGVVEQLLNFRLWLHMLVNVIGITPRGMLLTYSPTIIKNLGFSKTASNALNSVSSYGLIVFALTLAWLSDRTRWRGTWCLLALVWGTVFAGPQFALTTSNNKWTKYAILMLLNSSNGVIQTLNDAWVSGNARSPTERSIGLALCVAGSNIGGLIGQQLYRKEDAPRYTQAFLAVLCFYGSSIVVLLSIMALYWHLNRKAAKFNNSQTGEDEGVSEDAFRYEW